MADDALPDLASLITMVRLADTPLVGPPPSALLDPVPWDDYLRAIVDATGSLLDEVDTDTRNVILTLTRIWSTVATGELRTKDAAATWAIERLPSEHRHIVGQFRAAYLGEGPDEEPELRAPARRTAVHLTTQIRRAHDSPAAGPLRVAS